MTDWQRPPGTTGDISLIRATSVAVRDDERHCPTARSADLRLLLSADPAWPKYTKTLEDFTFGPLMAGLDLAEHQNWPLAKVISALERTRGRFAGPRPVHPSLVAWTAQALPRYLTARAAQQAGDDGDPTVRTLPIRYEWVALYERPTADSRGATRYERTAWGRRYASADGKVRDLWLPSIGKPRTNRPEVERAAIAHVLATGLACPRPGFHEQFRPFKRQPLPLPERVRVFGIGCRTGQILPLLDWDRDEVEQRYRDHAAPAFARVVDGVGTRPGSSCVRCKALSGCAALPRTPSLWAGHPADVTRRRRSLSAWDLRLYGQCPAQYHLTRQLNLQSLRPEHEAARRGRAVDDWLNEQHRARPARGCRVLTTPFASADDYNLSDQSARDVAAMLTQHAVLCPLGSLDPTERVLVQQQVSCYVPELDVVVFATPDLLYPRAGGWIWRETKTAASRLWDGRPLMRSYPQLALAVLLLAAGILGGKHRRSRVELELLHSDDSTLEELDPSRSAVVDEARQVIADLAEPLLRDTTYEPRVGYHCHGCEARGWCRQGAEHVDQNPLPTTADPAADDLI